MLEAHRTAEYTEGPQVGVLVGTAWARRRGPRKSKERPHIDLQVPSKGRFHGLVQERCRRAPMRQKKKLRP